MTEISSAAFERLALDACETIGYKGGQIAPYDVAGYDRVERREVSPRAVPQWQGEVETVPPLPAAATFEETPHLVRIGGFRRKNLYSPDEIGRQIRAAGIPWNDGLGNGLYESFLIQRKYGFNHVLEAPLFGYLLPFLEEEWPQFETEYQEQLGYLKARLEEVEPVYGSPIIGREKGVCVLNFYETPLSLFVQAYERAPQAVAALLLEQIGHDRPPEPDSPANRLALSRFWALLRRRQGQVLQRQRQLLRELLGPGTLFVGNFHELPAMDMAFLGQVYDHPAVAARPLLLDDPVMLRHYTAYFTQLFHDLTGRRPLVSVRLNLSAAGARFVPDANLIRRWHDQATRHGAGGFYLWPRDYPMDVAEPYDGPLVGNPVANTLPEVRWDTSLELLGTLARSRRLGVPPATVAILVPRDAALLYREEWRRIYALFSALAEARIHTRFLADWQIAQDGVPEEVRLLLAPVLEFPGPALRRELETFAGGGGRLLLPDGPLYDEEGNPAPRIEGAQTLDPALFSLFPLGKQGSLARLQAVASTLAETVESCEADPQSWLFDVRVANLPPANESDLRPPEPGIRFEHWMYEHGSDWIFPYLNAA